MPSAPIDEVFAEIRQTLDQIGCPIVIIRKSPEEIERMARAGRIVAETLALIGEHVRPGVTTAELDALADEFIVGQGGRPTFKGYRGYPAATCLSPNDDDRARDPGPVRARRGRRPLGRRRRDAGRLRRRLAPSLSRSARSRPEAERLLETLPGGARGRRRAVPAREPALRHLARRPAGDGERRLLGRAQPCRPRRRPLDARGPADPELRRARARPAARRGDDLRDRADDHRRPARTSTSTTTSGRSRPRTARWRPTSSTRSRSRRRARGS